MLRYPWADTVSFTEIRVKGQGSFSASLPSAFIQQNTVHKTYWVEFDDIRNECSVLGQLVSSQGLAMKIDGFIPQ